VDRILEQDGIKTGQLDRALGETAVQYGPRPQPILDPYKALIRTRLSPD